MNNLMGFSLSTISLGFTFSVLWPEIWGFTNLALLGRSDDCLPQGLQPQVRETQRERERGREKSTRGLPHPLGPTNIPSGDEVSLPSWFQATVGPAVSTITTTGLPGAWGIGNRKKKSGTFPLLSLSIRSPLCFLLELQLDRLSWALSFHMLVPHSQFQAVLSSGSKMRKDGGSQLLLQHF